MTRFLSGKEFAAFLLGFAAIIVLLPLLVIWSVNTLFPALAIAYGFFEWLSALILMMTVFGKSQLQKE